MLGILDAEVKVAKEDVLDGVSLSSWSNHAVRSYTSEVTDIIRIPSNDHASIKIALV